MDATTEKLKEMLGPFPVIRYAAAEKAGAEVRNPDLWCQLRHALAMERLAQAGPNPSVEVRGRRR